jgi:mannitol-1-phosphate/altronate dehydrogenase
MKLKWNVNPENSTTIARLLSELEGASYILDCLDDEEAYNYITELMQEHLLFIKNIEV